MTSEQFKQHLKDNKDRLKGCKLSVNYNGNKTWFTSLNEFGNYLLKILKPTSFCMVSNDFGNAFTVFDEAPSNSVPKLTESERQAGISKTLKKWGTTV